MKSVKLITWNEQEQRYEMSLGSLGISRPEEFGGGKFNILISRDTVEDQLVMNISDDRMVDGNIITINSDQNEGEANVTINAVSHFSDTVNIRHAIDFLDQNNNGLYYQKARLSAANVPNLALFEIGTEYNSPTYTLKAVNGPLNEGGLLYIPCKTRMTQHVTFTNGMQIACDATVNGTVNFNATVHFNSAATFGTITIGSQTLDEGTVINLLNSSSSGGSSVDLSRFVSAHSASNSTSGEEQSIYGGKTFKDETVFEDNVVLENGATVYPEEDISPSEDNAGTVGKNGYSFKEVFAKTVRANTIQREASGNTNNYGIVVNGDLTPGILMFRTGSRRATLGTEDVRWTVYANTLNATEVLSDSLSTDSVEADSADISIISTKELDVYDSEHQNHGTITYGVENNVNFFNFSNRIRATNIYASVGMGAPEISTDRIQMGEVVLTFDTSTKHTAQRSIQIEGSFTPDYMSYGGTELHISNVGFADNLFHSVCAGNGHFTQALHLISGCLITTEPCEKDYSEYTGQVANNMLFFASSANGGQATYSGVGSGTLCELTLASLNGDYHTIDLRTLSEVENSDSVSPMRVTVARGGLVLAMFPQALFHSLVQSDAPVTIPVGYCFTLENTLNTTNNTHVWYPAQLTFDKSSNTTVYVEDTTHQIQAGTYRLMSSVKIPQGPVSRNTTLTLPVFLQRTN